ncbi:uncharacterized protein J5F26_008116 isoform 2-T2 [Ciconia maguari]
MEGQERHSMLVPLCRVTMATGFPAAPRRVGREEALAPAHRGVVVSVLPCAPSPSWGLRPPRVASPERPWQHGKRTQNITQSCPLGPQIPFFSEAVLPSTPRGGKGAVEDSGDSDHMVEQDRSQHQPRPGALGQWGACSRRAPSSRRRELKNVMLGQQKEMHGR